MRKWIFWFAPVWMAPVWMVPAALLAQVSVPFERIRDAAREPEKRRL